MSEGPIYQAALKAEDNEHVVCWTLAEDTKKIMEAPSENVIYLMPAPRLDALRELNNRLLADKDDLPSWLSWTDLPSEGTNHWAQHVSVSKQLPFVRITGKSIDDVCRMLAKNMERYDKKVMVPESTAECIASRIAERDPNARGLTVRYLYEKDEDGDNDSRRSAYRERTGYATVSYNKKSRVVGATVLNANELYGTCLALKTGWSGITLTLSGTLLEQVCNLWTIVVLYDSLNGKNAHRQNNKFRELAKKWAANPAACRKHLLKRAEQMSHFCDWMDAETKSLSRFKKHTPFRPTGPFQQAKEAVHA